MRGARGAGKGEALSAGGVYAHFESVAKKDPCAAVCAKGLASCRAPVRFPIGIGGGVFFVGLFFGGFKVEDCFPLAGGGAGHVDFPERALVVCEFPFAKEA